MNAFALLGLPERFALPPEAVEEAWRTRIAAVHPDRFADRSAAEKRVAEQWAGRINEARDALMNPVSRATILLAALGADTGAETDTRMDPAFLMEQMSWREEAEEAKDAAAKAALLSRIDSAREKLIAALQAALDVEKNAASAREAVRRLMFIEKIRADLEPSAQSQEQ